jgi:hypothetical protein
MVFWIIGFGRVGRRALERLQRKSPEADFTIVDPRLTGPPVGLKRVHWHSGDGVAFLLDRHREVATDPSPWIVPALPRHLAFKWITARLRETFTVNIRPVPAALVAQLPNTVAGPEGQAYISNADFICPDNCSEPKAKCPVTRQTRPFDLHTRLSDIRIQGYRSVVIRSFQLAPGVGGYRGRQLEEALQTIQSQPGNYLLSTASKCHGVMHAFLTADQRSRINDQS